MRAGRERREIKLVDKLVDKLLDGSKHCMSDPNYDYRTSRCGSLLALT